MKPICYLILVLLVACNSTPNSSEEQPKHDSSLTNPVPNAVYADELPEQSPIQKTPVFKESISYALTEDSVMIFNKVPLKRDCFLINTQTLNSVRTQTTQHGIYFMEGSGYEKVITNTTLPLTKQESYDLAYFGESLTMEAVAIDSINDSSLIDSLTQTVDLVNNFGDRFADFGGTIQSMSSLLSPDVDMVHFNYLGENCYLINYYWQYNETNRGKGPSVLVTPTGNYPLTGPCSGNINLFIMNERLYINTNAGCCDCGITVDLLYEYDSIEFREVLSDGSWST